MDPTLYKNLFIAFFRSGILGYGGGPSSIPLIHKEVVEIYHWMSDEEFNDLIALSNTLPGPIVTKLAGYIGYRIAGVVGLLIALFASVVPTVILMIVLISMLTSFRDSPRVEGMTRAVTPVVGVMLFTIAYSFIKHSGKGIGWNKTLILGLVSVMAFLWLKLHPALLIGALILYALLPQKKGEKEA
ncbi:chromate transporter [Caldalkalibacillus mannanilyticus]|uniref:chromate transporter n=1 Tax=Caldalkalibacillus mannanilyticus TaxID=1418 RepID=UPI000469ED1C|nr:chromate transporter [Caldalkalibacillus mannanilyticus]